jgi:tight adherence protein B
VIGILVVVFIVLLIFGLMALTLRNALTGEEDVRNRIQAYVTLPELNARPELLRQRNWLSRLRVQLNVVLAGLSSKNLNLQLARSNWRMTVPEFLMVRLGATLAGLVLGWLIARSPFSGLALALVAYMIPGILLQRNISRRQIAFAKQLTDILSLLAGGVRAGYSLLQASEVVVRELKPPASEEFGRMVREVGLGLRLPEALQNLSTRMQNADLELVVTSVEIQYQVGGNMAIMLAAVTETIRERIRLFGEVRVITTQQRYTSYLLTALPVFMAALMFMVNPVYMSHLFDPGPLLCVPIGAVIGIVLGHFVIQRIIRLEV